MNFTNKKPPVCAGCLYPPDKKRVLFMFETVDAMLRFMVAGSGNPVDDIEDYNDGKRGFLLKCPAWECSRGFDVSSIKDLTEIFNWTPEDIDPDSEEYLNRVRIARAKSTITALEILNLALKEE